MLSLFHRIGLFTAFGLRTAIELPVMLVRPRLLLVQLARFAAGSAGIIAIAGLSLGLVTWMHLGQVLGRFDVQSLLPSLLMVAVVLEFGPVAAGLVAAGRIASGLAAELAAMKTTEQMDALQCLGVSPYRRLIAPRVFGCCLVLPLLTILLDYTAFFGSFLAERVGGDLSWALYRQYALEHLRSTEALLATAKTLVFGVLVGLLACWSGVTAPPSTEAVGAAATKAVVWSTVAVLVSNVFLVRLIQLVTGP